MVIFDELQFFIDGFENFACVAGVIDGAVVATYWFEVQQFERLHQARLVLQTLEAANSACRSL